MKTHATSRPTSDSWTREDDARVTTCRMVHTLLEGGEPTIRVPTMFNLPAGTHAYVCGPVRVEQHMSAGDGSYLHRSGFVIGPGPLGLALLPLSLALIGAGNASRRRQAELDAQTAFRPLLAGQVYVTNTGFVICGPFGVLPWTTGVIDGMEVLPTTGTVVMQGRSDHGRVTWHLITPWAQLIYAIWALREYEHHPQLLDGSWMHQAWLDRARAEGHDPWLRSSAVRRGR